MGHLLSTSKRIESDEAYGSYGADAPAHDGWKPGPEGVIQSGEPQPFERLHEAGAVTGVPVDMALPSIGHMVVFHLRDGDSRNRRCKFPAIVMDVDHEQSELKLWVIIDDGDTMMQDRVRPRVAPEQGWERIQGAADWELAAQGLIARLVAVEDLTERLSKQVFGQNLEEEESVLSQLREIKNHPALEVPPLGLGETATTTRTRRKRRG